MSNKNTTQHFHLSKFTQTSTPKWLVDYNDDMDKIDAALANRLDTPAQGSTALFTAGGAHTELGLKVDKSQITQATGNSTMGIISQDAVTRELGLKVDKANLAQGTGNSTNNPMSQNAVTNALNGHTKIKTLYNGNTVYIGNSFNEQNSIPYTNTEATLPEYLIISLESYNTSPTKCIVSINHVARTATSNGIFAIRLLSITNNTMSFNVAQTSLNPAESIYIRRVEGIYNVVN